MRIKYALDIGCPPVAVELSNISNLDAVIKSSESVYIGSAPQYEARKGDLGLFEHSTI